MPPPLVRQPLLSISLGYLKRIPGNLHLCIEEGTWSQWLVEILTTHVTEVVVLREEWRPGSKSDAMDAHDLADRIRTGYFRITTRRVSTPRFVEARTT